jgi:hypothetical protein
MSIDHQLKHVAHPRVNHPAVCSEASLRRVGQGISVNDSLKRWEPDFEQREMTFEQAAMWAAREQAFAQQMPRR